MLLRNTRGVLLLLPGDELSLIAEGSGLLSDLLIPFLSILDARCPIFDTDIDIFVNCNWINTRWQWFVHRYTQKLQRII
jgi:hypothetical protein